MGKAYQSQSISGYNSSPPPDDGSTTLANLVTWGGVKSKLGDPLSTLAAGINTQLNQALDFSGRTVAINDTATLADHMRTIECTAALTASLPEPFIMNAGFTVSYKNSGSSPVTINLINPLDTLDGVVNGTYTLSPGGFIQYKANVAQNGYYSFVTSGTSSSTQLSAISASVATNALTISINPQTISFRDPVLTAGDVINRNILSTISLVIPSGSTLGTLANQLATILVIAADVGDGTVDCVAVNWSGTGAFEIDEDDVLMTTSNTAPFNLMDTTYANDVLSNKPYRIMGFIEITEAVPGTWATAPSRVQPGGGVSIAQLLDTALIGYLPPNVQSANYTTTILDHGAAVIHPTSDVTARNFTIDSNANVPYPVGTAISFFNNYGAGVVTIKITSDTMYLAGSGATGNRTLAANGIAVAVKQTATTWMISGTGLT